MKVACVVTFFLILIHCFLLLAYAQLSQSSVPDVTGTASTSIIGESVGASSSEVSTGSVVSSTASYSLSSSDVSSSMAVLPSTSSGVAPTNSDPCSGNTCNLLWTSPISLPAGLQNRYGAGCAVTSNGLTVVGGRYAGGTLNDTWSSIDGISWNQTTSENKVFPTSTYVLTLSKSSNVVSFSTGVNDNKVFVSSDAGNNWQVASNNPGWSGRFGFAAASIPNTNLIIVAAGSSIIPPPVNDVWIMDTDPSKWTRQTIGTPAFAPNLIGAAMIAFNSTINSFSPLLLCGGAANNIPNNQVSWSYDHGVTWALTNTASWSPRLYHTLILDTTNTVYLVGGETALTGAAYTNDVFYSYDFGYTWQSLASTTDTVSYYPLLAAPCVAMYTNKIYVFTGIDSTNTYFGLTSAELLVGPAAYVPPSLGSVTGIVFTVILILLFIGLIFGVYYIRKTRLLREQAALAEKQPIRRKKKKKIVRKAAVTGAGTGNRTVIIDQSPLIAQTPVGASDRSVN